MVMETSRTTSPSSVVSEFEGTLLKSNDSFSYFMLLAFDASGLIRFAVLLFLWPVIKLLDVFNFRNASLKLMIFVATVGLRVRDIESAARAVLPKFYMDDLSMDTWRVFSSCKEKVVVTRLPRLMVQFFAKEHLNAGEVIGAELIVNRLGFITGLIREGDIEQYVSNRVADMFADRRPHLGIRRPAFTASTTFLSLCEEQIHEPVQWSQYNQQIEIQSLKQVVFNDGILMNRPTPTTALLILLWFPFGIVLAAIRILVGSILPIWAIPYIIGISGCRVIVKGSPPPAADSGGILFVCNHRSAIDTLLVSYALGRNIPSVAWMERWRLFDILWPFPMVLFSGNRDVDAAKMKYELSRGDLVICPEGCFSYQPFMLRFSAMFAELTDKIVPVAINCNVQFFQSRMRSCNGLKYLFSLLMNPTIVYEVTLLNQLPYEATCSSGKSHYDVANHVQRILADTLGFECTNLGVKDRYKILG